MTFAEMTPEKWRMLGWIAMALALLWCAAWLLGAAMKGGKNDDNEAGESPKDW